MSLVAETKGGDFIKCFRSMKKKIVVELTLSKSQIKDWNRLASFLMDCLSGEKSKFPTLNKEFREKVLDSLPILEEPEEVNLSESQILNDRKPAMLTLYKSFFIRVKRFNK